MADVDLPSVTVAICTRNRAELLRRSLQTLCQIIVPNRLTWEIIVVDNGSNDDTQKVVESFTRRLPIRSVVESEPGLSHARNRAVHEARGDYICWTDDDTDVHPNWLVGYVNAFVRHTDGSVFAGRVLPVLEGKPPAWFAQNRSLLTDLLAECDLGNDPKPLNATAGEWPIGANFALRMEEQRCHSFHPNLGVSPKFRRLGEETAVIRAIIAEGGKGYYVPDSIVNHYIVEQRQTRKYIFVYHCSAGETWAALDHYRLPQFMGQPIPSHNGRKLKGAPFWLWRLTFINYVSYVFAKLFRRSGIWLPRLQKYAYYRGALEFYIRLDSEVRAPLGLGGM